jgi:HSP20 family molecular chaperone IbpA
MTRAQENKPVQQSALAEFDPFRDLLRSNRFSRLLGDSWAPEGVATGSRWAPAMDVAEGKDSYTITLEVPGANKEDISVECHDGTLTINGETHDEREERDEHRHYVERVLRKFQPQCSTSDRRFGRHQRRLPGRRSDRRNPEARRAQAQGRRDRRLSALSPDASPGVADRLTPVVRHLALAIRFARAQRLRDRMPLRRDRKSRLCPSHRSWDRSGGHRAEFEGGRHFCERDLPVAHALRYWPAVEAAFSGPIREGRACRAGFQAHP